MTALIIGEAWGRDEAACSAPFVGATGRDLNELMEQSGFLPRGTARPLNNVLWKAVNNPRDAAPHIAYRDEVYHAAGLRLTNVLNFQPPGNRVEDLCGPRWGNLPAIRPGKYLRPEFAPELDRLKLEIETQRPNIIIGLGATAVWFALGTGQISKHRGTVAQSRYGKFLATYHPAYLMRGAEHLRPIVVLDLIKAQRESAFAEVRRPERFVHVPECVQDLEWGLREAALAQRLSIDIETAGDQITCIGFAWSPTHTFVVPILDTRNASRSYWSLDDERLAWDYIRRFCRLPMPKVFQNGLYDLHFLWRRYGITVANCEDDTMLLHHALQPEVQKGLGFLGSLYTDEPAWKTMRPRGKGTIKREDE